MDNIASKKSTHNCGKLFFVKINMDGVPIGTKSGINVMTTMKTFLVSYFFHYSVIMELVAQMKLSHIASFHCSYGQRDSCAEYTLVYDDNEGNNMLFGDRSWTMIVGCASKCKEGFCTQK
ncbi:hypothetical protein PHAVU_004G083000 [Phaseolus vulgaris]|uniref:Auxin-induced protein n=1 Tax=Phaseolus vulgaris TaxID=3885 RepID=V7C162_PHAVU|nr:hypothetical protein PHAVU_004G083000g [Phaseolus vulgaris]ESW23869.1 hypothetical protein PHAVU_004G083000g [Phaseolus vulgaris]